MHVYMCLRNNFSLMPKEASFQIKSNISAGKLDHRSCMVD